MPGVTQADIDQCMTTLRNKIEVKSNFAETEVQAKLLEKTFKNFDGDRSGFVSFPEFEKAMTAENFVGVQQKMKKLFDEFDEDGSEQISYREFSQAIFGLTPKLDATSKSVVERVKAKIIERGGASGIHGVTKILRRMDRDGSYTLDKGELLEGLMVYGIRDLDETEGGDMDKIMTYFDRDGSGRISIEEFLRGITGKMSKRRIKFVKLAFGILSNGKEVATIEDFKSAYDASQHPEVVAGRITEDEAVEEFMSVYEEGNQSTDGRITYFEFLDYYKGLSCGIQEDDYFELMMRNAWHISGGEGWCANTTCRRVLVKFANGEQEVMEIKDDLGIGRDDIDIMRERLISQGDVSASDKFEISLAD